MFVYVQGDSGGPIYCGTNKSVLYGVSSYGHECADTNKPGGIYTSVKHFEKWIRTAISVLQS